MGKTAGAKNRTSKAGGNSSRRSLEPIAVNLPPDFHENPATAETTLNQKEVKVLLIQHGGRWQAKGYSWEILAKHLGAGCYRITLKRGEKSAAPEIEDSNLPKFEKDMHLISEAVRG